MFVEHVEEGLSTKKLEPSAKNLAYLLRHKELWPEGFSWYYPISESCAIGLAHTYWGSYAGDKIISDLGLQGHSAIFSGYRKSVSLFGFRLFSLPLAYIVGLEITPEDVAREIELVI